MDFTQRKLTKAEWESIEVPIVPQERRICELIQKGFHDVMTSQNNTVTLLHYCKVTKSADMDQYIYTQYLHTPLHTLATKYKFGLGDNVYMYYEKPSYVINEKRFLTSGFKKNEYLAIYKVNGDLV